MNPTDCSVSTQLWVCVSGATKENKTPLIASSLAVERSLHRRAVKRNGGCLRETLCFPHSEPHRGFCVTCSALSGLLVAQHGDSVSHGPWPGSSEHLREVKM